MVSLGKFIFITILPAFIMLFVVFVSPVAKSCHIVKPRIAKAG